MPKTRRMPRVLKIGLPIVAGIAVLSIVLALAAHFAGYPSIGSLLRYLADYIGYIFTERLFA